MNLLALESSTEACSVALCVGEKLYSSFELAPQQHAQRFLPMLDALVNEAGIKPGEINGVAYGHGPGSFTGVRIAASMMQGIAIGCEVRVVGVSTLHAIAYRVWQESGYSKVLAAIDARMSAVYWGCYQFDEQGRSIQVVKESVAAPEDVEHPAGNDWVGAGSGWQAYESALLKRCEGVCKQSLGIVYPRAVDVLMIAKAEFINGRSVQPEEAIPVYLRNKVAMTEKERQEMKNESSKEKVDR